MELYNDIKATHILWKAHFRCLVLIPPILRICSLVLSVDPGQHWRAMAPSQPCYREGNRLKPIVHCVSVLWCSKGSLNVFFTYDISIYYGFWRGVTAFVVSWGSSVSSWSNR
jgi:hypothetical protein